MARRHFVPYVETLMRPLDKRQMTSWGQKEMLESLVSDVPIIGHTKLGLIGPQCCICNRVVSAERIGDQYNGPKGGWVEVVVSCHGAEDSARFDYASREWDEHDLRRSMHSWRWFDPARQADNVSVDVK